MEVGSHRGRVRTKVKSQPPVRYDLDERAFEYVREKLKEGATLSQLLIDRGAGHVSTWLPAGIDDRQVYGFKDPILPEVESIEHPQVLMPNGRAWRATLKKNMDEVLAALIVDHLTETRGSSLFEDNAVPASMLRREQIDVRTARFGVEVYRLLIASDASDQDLIKRTIRTARSWNFVIALTDAALPQWPRTHEIADVQMRDLENAAQNARSVVVGAYDGEGFLHWRPLHDS